MIHKKKPAGIRKEGMAMLAAAALLFAGCAADSGPDPDPAPGLMSGSYTVTFDKNGGDTEAGPQTKTVTAPATTVGSLPATEPTRAGYTFSGWNTAADGTGSEFTAFTTVKANLTVYAQWQQTAASSFTVTFDKNGGDTDASPLTKTVNPPSGTVDALPATEPTRAGYAFNGWNTAADGTGSTFTASTTVAASITVYAQWNEVLASIAALEAYFAAASGGDSTASPLAVTVGIELSAANWSGILSAISAADKYVALNLAACAKSTHSEGGGLYGSGAFNPNYKPSADENWIVSLVLPDAATSIGSTAFSMGVNGSNNVLASVSGAGVTAIGHAAFQSCSGLISVNFPVATSIGDTAFQNCWRLTSANFPKAATIDEAAFKGTGSALLSITFGSTPPKLSTGLFSSSNKTVTVRYPVGASGYGAVPTNTTTKNWGNAFRGMGWNGSSYLTGIVNSDITLKYETYTP